ncbi:rRNA adenine dimethyltransferase family protein [Paenibacillus sp. J22TS3]|uniref:ribosomal RNA small subunit methyltransferase A n=1 Tax=Paenibacillus sp. J22TS3 TaxID=2807192 RepID=UPI001B02B2F1|nr:rRNA adenine dimethyltransferase family protein [Paenibacillus sp. J22TS3]GIP21144.1 hypothetical protein J22TS3_14190 [Paenibacillus sp. J22TS3]
MTRNRSRNREGSNHFANFPAQHLLIHPGLIHEMIALARIGPKDTALDIGAGTGAITVLLTRVAARVIAVENDPEYIRKLTTKMRDVHNVSIRQADVLKMDMPKQPFIIVANIPYSITTPIFGRLFDHPQLPVQRAVLVIEKGAARRFTADPITDPRILKWRMYYDFRLVRTVSPSYFSPPPRVESAVILVERKRNPLIPYKDHGRFMALASNVLKAPMASFYRAVAGIFTPGQVKHLVRMLKIHRDQPVSSLNERQWGELFMTMLQYVEPHRWPKRPKPNHQNRWN